MMGLRICQTSDAQKCRTARSGLVVSWSKNESRCNDASQFCLRVSVCRSITFRRMTSPCWLPTCRSLGLRGEVYKQQNASADDTMELFHRMIPLTSTSGKANSICNSSSLCNCHLFNQIHHVLPHNIERT